MKTLLIIGLILIASLCQAQMVAGLVSVDEYNRMKELKHNEMIANILTMPIEEAMALDAVIITCTDIQFFYTDSTLNAHLVYYIDSAGFENTFHDVRRGIDLKQLAVRNALRANPVIRPVLDDTGQFLYNQFTNF